MKVYPFCYDSDLIVQKFKEWHFIKRFKQTLNGKL